MIENNWKETYRSVVPESHLKNVHICVQGLQQENSYGGMKSAHWGMWNSEVLDHRLDTRITKALWSQMRALYSPPLKCQTLSNLLRVQAKTFDCKKQGACHFWAWSVLVQCEHSLSSAQNMVTCPRTDNAQSRLGLQVESKECEVREVRIVFTMGYPQVSLQLHIPIPWYTHTQVSQVWVVMGKGEGTVLYTPPPVLQDSYRIPTKSDKKFIKLKNNTMPNTGVCVCLYMFVTTLWA